jgi:hypothetical protein
VTECTKKRFIEENEEARFVGPRDKIVKLREIADSLGVREISEAVTIAPGPFLVMRKIRSVWRLGGHGVGKD